jgi:sugar phosphate permease
LVGLIILTVKETKPKVVTETKKQNVFSKSAAGIKYLLSHKELRSLVISDIFVYIGAYFLIWLYQPMLEEVGLAIIYFGLVRSAFSVMGMFATGNINFTIKLFRSEKNFVNYSALLVVLSMFLVALSPGIITVVIAVIIIGWAGTARTTYLNTIMNEYVPSENRATILSAISTLNTLVYALMNPLIGFLADYSLRLSFFVVGLIPLMVLIFIPFTKSEKNTEVATV